MVRLLKKLLILFFDILYVVMFAFAIGFVKQLRFDCSVIDFTVAVLLYTALRFYLHKKKTFLICFVKSETLLNQK